MRNDEFTWLAGFPPSEEEIGELEKEILGKEREEK